MKSRTIGYQFKDNYIFLNDHMMSKLTDLKVKCNLSRSRDKVNIHILANQHNSN
jgi:hypothetical protein